MSKTSFPNRRTAGGRAFARRAGSGGRNLFRGPRLRRDAQAVGEVCFNTAMTGYEEVLSDPSYAGQIVCFTFPAYRHRRHQRGRHRVDQSGGARTDRARGCDASVELAQSRDARPLAEASQHSGDRRHRHTRARLAHPREGHAAWRDRASAGFDIAALTKAAKEFSGLEGLDLAKDVSCAPDEQVEPDAVAAGQRIWRAGRAELPRGRDRLWRQAQHPARTCRRRRGHHRRARERDAGRRDEAQAAWRGAVQRPRRSGGDGRIRDPDDQRA